jgi:hypothetical protein
MIMKMFATLDKAKPDRIYKRLKLGGGQAYYHSSVLDCRGSESY